MKIINNLLLLYFKSRLNKIERFKKNPEAIQAKTFFYLINRAKNTDWGLKYNYKNIAKSSDFKEAWQLFKKNVPLSNYDQLKPWITRMRMGEINVLWPGRIDTFSKSSGTTSDKSKYIPVTKRALKKCHFAGGKDAFAMYFKENPNSKMFFGKILGLVGSKREDELNKKHNCGDISAIIMDKLSWWIQKKRSPKIKTALIESWDEKLKQTIIDSKQENITALAGVPSWMLVLLRQTEKETGKKIKELWPNLEVLFYGGMSLGPYRQQYQELFGDNFKFIETYGSAEGFFGANADNSFNDMLLMLDYEIFYEFIPLEELGKEQSQSYNISEVELNRNYAIVISTNAGLWRYIVGDTVKFTNLKPYRFIISGRTKSFINVFGEELMVDNANQAMTMTCQQTGALMREYSAAPIFMTKEQQGGHEWLIEFEKEPADINEFAKILDQNLQKLNSDYEAKRYKDITLSQLKIVLARPNLFIDWLASKNRLGGQNKVPRLFNDRTYLDEMLRLN